MTASSSSLRGELLRRAACVAAIVLASLVAGCASKQIDVDVSSTAETNGGKPFYVVVRAVEQATFVTDGYDAIASMVFANPPDATVLKSDVVYPGTKCRVTVTKPDALPLGVYFLFSQPGERWKVSKVQPLPNSWSIELDKNSVKEGD